MHADLQTITTGINPDQCERIQGSGFQWKNLNSEMQEKMGSLDAGKDGIFGSQHQAKARKNNLKWDKGRKGLRTWAMCQTQVSEAGFACVLGRDE